MLNSTAFCLVPSAVATNEERRSLLPCLLASLPPANHLSLATSRWPLATSSLYGATLRNNSSHTVSFFQ